MGLIGFDSKVQMIMEKIKPTTGTEMKMAA